MTDLMSHSRFHLYWKYVLRRAWLSLWNKHMLLAGSTRYLAFLLYTRCPQEWDRVAMVWWSNTWCDSFHLCIGYKIALWLALSVLWFSCTTRVSIHITRIDLTVTTVVILTLSGSLKPRLQWCSFWTSLTPLFHYSVSSCLPFIPLQASCLPYFNPFSSLESTDDVSRDQIAYYGIRMHFIQCIHAHSLSLQWGTHIERLHRNLVGQIHLLWSLPDLVSNVLW